MPEVRRLVVWIALASLVATAPDAAHAYRITRLGAQHEIMTVWAERCLAEKGPLVWQERCPWPSTKKAFDATRYSQSPWAEPVRWPDDVKRRATGFRPIQLIKLGYLGLGACRHRIMTRTFPGLQCESDVGRLQFFHAMRALKDVKDNKKDYETDVETRDHIREWTKFSFSIANGTKETKQGTTRLCEVLPTTLGDAFAAYCAQANPEPGPSVAQYFASYCAATCKPREPVQAAMRAAALGAILHLIQDSFSQSHAARGGIFPHGPYIARVVCVPVEQFYSFDGEQAKVHKAGDLTPAFDAGCATSAVVDPITASARLMWLWQNGCDSSWAVELVDKGVLGGRGPAKAPDSVAQCRLTT